MKPHVPSNFFAVINASLNFTEIFTLEWILSLGLQMLDCTHNELTQVPEEVSHMTKLEQLYLRHNKLTHLPMLTNCAALKVGSMSSQYIYGPRQLVCM